MIKSYYKNDELPSRPCCYIMISKDLELMYIGHTKDLKKRIYNHERQMIVNFDELYILIVIFTSDKYDAHRIEDQLLSQMKTKYNSNWFCNKISKEEETYYNDLVRDLLED